MPINDLQPPPELQVPVPLATLAATLRPQLTSTRSVQPRRAGAAPGVINTYTQGHPDEIWLKLLAMKHGIERHTLDDWHALIAKYKGQPAHPADPKYGVGA